MSYPFAILAGKPPERDEFLNYANIDNKSLITFKGKSYVQIAVEAALDSGLAKSILLIGISPSDLSFDYDTDMVSFLELEGTQFDKIFQATQRILEDNKDSDQSLRALYMSADMPFLTSDVIHAYLEKCGDQSSDLYYPVTPKEVAEGALPNLHFNSMNIKDGKLVSGNMILANPHIVVQRYDMIKFTSENRKKFVWGVLKSSPWLFLKLIFKRVRLAEVEGLMTKILKIRSKVVVSDLWQLSFDVDRPEQLDYLRSLEKEI